MRLTHFLGYRARSGVIQTVLACGVVCGLPEHSIAQSAQPQTQQAPAKTAPRHPKEPKEPDDPNSPRALLISSHFGSQNLRPGDLTYLLEMESDMAAMITPDLCRQWSRELLAFASTLPPSWDRLAAQKNALVALSSVDAKEAFELFPKMDIPVPLADGRLREDLRADGATTVFVEYWKHDKSAAALSGLREQANKLGNTGQYPYLAMQPILQDVIQKNEMEGEAIFLETLVYYRRRSIIDREDDDFREFLNASWGSLTDPLRRMALTAAVNRLLNESDTTKDGEIFSGSIKTGKGTRPFQNKAQMLLYQLMPTIQEFDHKWAEQLAEDHPSLKDASASDSHAGTMTILFDLNNTPSSAIAGLQTMASQSSIYNSAISVAAKDPDSALLMAPQLDASHQAALYAEIASYVYPKDAARASSLMSVADERIKNMNDPYARFQALISYAQAALKQKDDGRYKKAIDDGFSLGLELISEELQAHPQEWVYQTKVFSGLEQLATIDMRAEDDKALTRIRAIGNEAVRSILLAESASVEKTLREQRASHATQ